VAEIEFAFLAPGLLLFLIFAGDMVHMGRGHLRVQSAAAQLGQVVSQCRNVSAGDRAELFSLAKRLLGPFAIDGKWGVVITAIGRDPDNKAFTWSMQQVPSGYTVASQGSTVPAGLTLSANQVVFRTEVVADVASTVFSKAISLPAGLVRTGAGTGGMDKASATVVHMTRSPTTAKLKDGIASSGERDCMT